MSVEANGREALDPLAALLRDQPVVILDGGLATALEALGHDLADPLWSARTLIEDPDAVRDVHLAYLEAGADCIESATYQATRTGFERRGATAGQALDWLGRGVQLAVSARDEFWGRWTDEAGTGSTDRRQNRTKPLVAASVGPYGAFLADGSEYRGDYGADRSVLHDFHGERFALFAGTEADLIACETIPSGLEVEVLVELFEATPGAQGWISLQCRDPKHLADGSPLVDVVARCEAAERVIGVGVNCVAPALVPLLLQTMREVSSKPRVVYPNSGEQYDAVDKRWRPAVTGETDARAAHWVESAPGWVGAGANVVGGCCRTGPDDIRRLRRLLLEGY